MVTTLLLLEHVQVFGIQRVSSAASRNQPQSQQRPHASLLPENILHQPEAAGDYYG